MATKNASGRRHAVTLIPGDWIGPETCAVTQAVIAASQMGLKVNQ